MSSQEEVDPDYLWILPKCFELTPEVRYERQMHEIVQFGSQASYLNRLNALANLQFRSTAMNWEDGPEHEQLHQEWQEFLQEANLLAKEYSLISYMFHKECLEALQAVGLDVRGGLAGLRKTMHEAKAAGLEYMPTTRLLVRDAEKARKHINIGIHLNSDIVVHPSTLDEASGCYTTISSLVGNTLTMKDLTRKLEENPDEDESWLLAREIFRLETKERYRGMLIDVALEEKLEEQLSNRRAAKRSRRN
ncbi:hypothetical protein BDV96DRAFT_647503 [Lophiotrema nucula]|uniref:Uncharacterized protein n=1 Tax=Lophiotrema nucula TaxID=690887 RepID=A0A6A5Z4J9_9PLEO|nr:hypothetical protein BDV96DRAFT_647503 [Lophiotrema nucula]